MKLFASLQEQGLQPNDDTFVKLVNVQLRTKKGPAVFEVRCPSARVCSPAACTTP